MFIHSGSNKCNIWSYTAWTLVKYDFPGKRILDGFIELPFCLPTAVAGITLSKMYSIPVYSEHR